MHLFDIDMAYSSLYAVPAWAFERCMGLLARIHTNNYHGGTLEATYMRAWWKMMHAALSGFCMQSRTRSHPIPIMITGIHDAEPFQSRA